MKKIIMLVGLLHSVVNGQAQGAKTYWSPAEERAIPVEGIREIIPNEYKTFRLVQNNLKTDLFSAPHDKQLQSKASPMTIELPMPDGTLQHFRVAESSIMEEGLANQFPQVKTFEVRGVEDRYAIGVLDWTEFGFHGMIRSPDGDVFIDPYSRDNKEMYMSYYVKDFEKAQGQTASNEEVFEMADTLSQNKQTLINPKCSGTELRRYRLAVACTGEFAIAVTGTTSPDKVLVFSRVVTIISRVNLIFMSEVAISLELVARNSEILYMNPTTDPFAGNDDGTLLVNESQRVIDQVIGSSNYDIGHTFSTGGGGRAALGSACNPITKGKGITGDHTPVGDPNDINYVEHEMGHQFGANHTFNASTGSCSTRKAATAVEPGSGVTIMAYAGLCEARNTLEERSIPYFHSVSFDEIMDYTTNRRGNTCPILIPSGNTPPVVTTARKSFPVPIGTPFQLEGSATDADGNVLLYSWEEMDAGAIGGDANNGKKPFFRSYPPTKNPKRVFPREEVILGLPNVSNKGEYLPTTTQTLQFRLTVRDNGMGAGGVCYPTATTTVYVRATPGPFSVSYPTKSDVIWVEASSEDVTWSVNGTTAAPINCANVNILLSYDDGRTYEMLLANTPNDGYQLVTVPGVTQPKTNCRIRVEAVGNIFFDVSDNRFTIVPRGLDSNHPEASTTTDRISMSLFPNPCKEFFTVSAHGLKGSKTTVYVYDSYYRMIISAEYFDFKTTKSPLFERIDLPSSMGKGLYYVAIMNGNRSGIATLLKD